MYSMVLRPFDFYSSLQFSFEACTYKENDFSFMKAQRNGIARTIVTADECFQTFKILHDEYLH